MANIKSAKKRIKVIDKKTARNKRVKDHVKQAIREFDDAMVAEDMTAAGEKLVAAEKKLKQAASKGSINKFAASRKVSRLTKRFNAAKAAK
ncbi:MAG: 30S ribosomal protein S20 [Firmicutes bacterium]|nr:30S ribosomal protein S20 [Bacillota bacterium]